MVTCTIHRFTLKSKDFGHTFYDVSPLETLQCPLSVLESMDMPSITQASPNTTTTVANITLGTIAWNIFKYLTKTNDNFEPQHTVTTRPIFSMSLQPIVSHQVEVTSDNHWRDYLEEYLQLWVLKDSHHAARLFITEKGELLEYSVDFIELAHKDKPPASAVKLRSCLNLCGNKELFDSSNFNKVKTLFPYIMNKKTKKQNNHDYVISFKTDKGDTIEVQSEIKDKAAIQKGPKINVDVHNRIMHPWEDYLHLSFMIWNMNHPNQKVEYWKDEDATKFFHTYTHTEDEFFKFAFFLGALTTNDPSECTVWEWKEDLAMKLASLTPLVGSAMTLKDSFDSFKVGDVNNGVCNLLLGSVSMIADVTLVGGPAAKAVKGVTAAGKWFNVATKAEKICKTYSTVTTAARGALGFGVSKLKNKLGALGGDQEYTHFSRDELKIMRMVFPSFCTKHRLMNQQDEISGCQKLKNLSFYLKYDA